VKRSLAVVCALVVVLVLVPLALAGNGGGNAHGKKKFQLNGVVVSGDSAGGSLVVLVKRGSKTVKLFRGKELTLRVDAEARIVAHPGDDSEEPVVLTLADLVAGMRVHVGGRIDRTDPANPVFIAKRIIVKPAPQTTTSPSPSP
jgi:hypothetical protein